MTDMDTLRDAAVTALKGRTAAGQHVYSPRDWPTTHAAYPAIIVRTTDELAVSKGRFGVPEFDNTITLAIAARVEATTEAAADTAVRALAQQIKAAILRNGQFIYQQEVQQFATFATKIDVTAEGKRHIGDVLVSFGVEVFQVYDPTIDAEGVALAPALLGIDIHADLAAPFDAAGTYSAPAHPPYTPPAAPRTSGPDGRDEAAMTIDLPQ